MKKILSLLSFLESDFHRRATFTLFARIFYAWLFYSVAILTPHHLEIWGPDALVSRSTFQYSWLDYAFKLSLHPSFMGQHLLFLVPYLLLLAFGITGRSSRLSNLFIFLLNQNLNALAGVILDGGTNLSELLLVYMCFINHSPKTSTARFAELSNLSSNLMYFVCQMQVCLVYICAGLLKVNGELWQQGMTLYYILQGVEYSHPWIASHIIQVPFFASLATYFAIAFQNSFVYLIWFNKTKWFIILAGWSLHLGIAFAMGLFSFGLIMCISYILFFDCNLSRRICSSASGWKWIRPDFLSKARVNT